MALALNLSALERNDNNQVMFKKCTKCNSAIGLFKENEENMYNAINYLTTNKL